MGSSRISAPMCDVSMLFIVGRRSGLVNVIGNGARRCHPSDVNSSMHSRCTASGNNSQTYKVYADVMAAHRAHLRSRFRSRGCGGSEIRVRGDVDHAPALQRQVVGHASDLRLPLDRTKTMSYRIVHNTCRLTHRSVESLRATAAFAGYAAVGSTHTFNTLVIVPSTGDQYRPL